MNAKAKKQNVKSQKKNTAANAIKNRSNIEARRARWRRLIQAWIDDKTGKTALFIPREWLEAVEGRSMVDVIEAAMCEDRGIGVRKLSYIAKFNFEADEKFESASVNERDSHECDEVNVYCMRYFSRQWFGVSRMSNNNLEKLISKYYRRGDVGVENAVIRAVQAAL